MKRKKEIWEGERRQRGREGEEGLKVLAEPWAD